MKYRAIYVVGPVDAATLDEAVGSLPSYISAKQWGKDYELIRERVEYFIPGVWITTSPEQES